MFAQIAELFPVEAFQKLVSVCVCVRTCMCVCMNVRIFNAMCKCHILSKVLCISESIGCQGITGVMCCSLFVMLSIFIKHFKYECTCI